MLARRTLDIALGCLVKSSPVFSTIAPEIVRNDVHA